MKRILICLLGSGAATLGWAQTYLSPNQLGSGNLPGTYANLIFSLSDGNWTSQISLPATASDKATIKISSTATWGAQVLQANSDVPVPALALAAGQSLQYQYAAGQQRWEIVAPTVVASNIGNSFNMTTTTDRVVRARMANGAWSPSLNLPASAVDGAVVLINSTATWSSRIDASHVMHASTMPLRNKDDYAYVFNNRLGKWVLSKSPETTLSLSQLPKGQFPVPVTALTKLTIPAGSAATTLTLPAGAGDRDRIVVSSNAQARSTIANTAVQGVGTMTIGQNQSYEFMWNAGLATWVVQKMPRTQVSVGALASADMAPTLTPVTEVFAGDGNWKPLLVLPANAKPGDRVLVRSAATWGFSVGLGDAAGGRYAVSRGEDVAFVRQASAWSRETETIRLLLSYGQGVTAQFGAAAARARQLESLRMTNEALDNSGARFRFQAAGLLEVPNLGSTLGDAVNLARSHAGIQTERQRVLADAVYYEGVESGCGLAWFNSTPSAYNMVATGSTACGTTVMRHELGHNMGLNHGNGVVATAMSGNALPFFATPRRFEPTLRVPMGHAASVPDEVSAMDKNALAVARFR